MFNSGCTRALLHSAPQPSLYCSAAKVWQAVNIGKAHSQPDNAISSGAIHREIRGHCLGVGCQTLPVVRYPSPQPATRRRCGALCAAMQVSPSNASVAKQCKCCQAMQVSPSRDRQSLVSHKAEIDSRLLLIISRRCNRLPISGTLPCCSGRRGADALQRAWWRGVHRRHLLQRDRPRRDRRRVRWCAPPAPCACRPSLLPMDAPFCRVP